LDASHIIRTPNNNTAGLLLDSSRNLLTIPRRRRFKTNFSKTLKNSNKDILGQFLGSSSQDPGQLATPSHSHSLLMHMEVLLQFVHPGGHVGACVPGCGIGEKVKNGKQKERKRRLSHH